MDLKDENNDLTIETLYMPSLTSNTYLYVDDNKKIISKNITTQSVSTTNGGTSTNVDLTAYYKKNETDLIYAKKLDINNINTTIINNKNDVEFKLSNIQTNISSVNSNLNTSISDNRTEIMNLFNDFSNESQTNFSNINNTLENVYKKTQTTDLIEENINLLSSAIDEKLQNEYYDKTAVELMVSGVEPATVDLSAYALKDDIPDITSTLLDYAKKSEIPSPQDLSVYALKNEIPIIPSLAPYALKSEIPSQQDLTPYVFTNTLINNYYKKEDVYNKNEIVNEILSPYVKNETIQKQFELYCLKDLTYTKEDVDKLIPAPQNLTSYLSKTEALNEYALKSNTYNKGEVDTLVGNATNVSSSLTNYVLKNDINQNVNMKNLLIGTSTNINTSDLLIQNSVNTRLTLYNPTALGTDSNSNISIDFIKGTSAFAGNATDNNYDYRLSSLSTSNAFVLQSGYQGSTATLQQWTGAGINIYKNTGISGSLNVSLGITAGSITLNNASQTATRILATDGTKNIITTGIASDFSNLPVNQIMKDYISTELSPYSKTDANNAIYAKRTDYSNNFQAPKIIIAKTDVTLLSAVDSDLEIFNTNPNLSLYSSSGGNITIDLIRGSRAFGSDANIDYRILNNSSGLQLISGSGGTLSTLYNLTPSSFTLYNDLHLFKITSTTDNFLMINNNKVLDSGIKKTDVASVISDNGTNKTNIGNLQTANSKNVSDISALQIENGNIKTSIGNLQTENGTIKTNIENLQTENTTNKNNIASLQSSITSINTINSNQSTSITNLETTRAKISDSTQNLFSRSLVLGASSSILSGNDLQLNGFNPSMNINGASSSNLLFTNGTNNAKINFSNNTTNFLNGSTNVFNYSSSSINFNRDITISGISPNNDPSSYTLLVRGDVNGDIKRSNYRESNIKDILDLKLTDNDLIYNSTELPITKFIITNTYIGFALREVQLWVIYEKNGVQTRINLFDNNTHTVSSTGTITASSVGNLTNKNFNDYTAWAGGGGVSSFIIDLNEKVYFSQIQTLVIYNKDTTGTTFSATEATSNAKFKIDFYSYNDIINTFDNTATTASPHIVNLVFNDSWNTDFNLTTIDSTLLPVTATGYTNTFNTSATKFQNFVISRTNFFRTKGFVKNVLTRLNDIESFLKSVRFATTTTGGAVFNNTNVNFFGMSGGDVSTVPDETLESVTNNVTSTLSGESKKTTRKKGRNSSDKHLEDILKGL